MEKKNENSGIGVLLLLSIIASTIEWGFGGLAISTGVFAVVFIMMVSLDGIFGKKEAKP